MPKISTITLYLFTAAALLTASAAAQSGSSNKAASAAQSTPSASSQQASGQASTMSPELPTKKDQVSYAIGMNIGKGLSRDSIEVDPNVMLRGLKDALSGGKTLMTDEQVQQTMMQLQSQVRDQEEAKRKQEAETNAKAGAAFLAANKSKPGVITLPDGLQYKVIKEGTGPKPTISDIVSCNYRGTLIDGQEFDSTAKHGGEPATFPVRGVIKGWTEVLQLMPVGSKYEVYLPPDLAYGERGAGADIGPNETLVFEVELVSIKPPQPVQSQPGNPSAQPQQ